MKAYLSIISKQTKLKCVCVIALAAVGALLASIHPVALGELCTDISNGTIRTLSQAAAALISFGLIYLTADFISTRRRVFLDCIVATHESEIRELIFKKLIKLPMNYFEDGLSGEKTARLNQGIAGLSQLIKIMCNDIFATVFTMVCTLIQVFLHASGLMVGFMFLYFIITVTISVFQIRSQNGIRESIVNKKNRLDGQTCQTISNIEPIRAWHSEDYETQRLLPSIKDICSAEKRHHRYMGGFDCLKQCCKIVFQVGLLVVSMILISRGEMDRGSVIAVCLLFQQLIKPIDDVYRFMDETAASVIKAKALLEVAARPSDEVFDIESSEEGPQNSTIHLEDVVITNPDKSKPLACYEDLSIPCDRMVAFVGPSGCGKTTLARALTRIFPVVRGNVDLFGRPQSSYSQKELSSLIYYDPQETFFFAGSLRENLIYGLERSCKDAELAEVLRNVCLVGNWEGNLGDTEGVLDRQISEGAANLSAGQRQRLALARAYLRQPKEFIFDESTANLDKATTIAVLSNLKSYARSIGSGIICISHDKTVLDICDQVIEINNKLKHLDNKKLSA